MIKLIKGKFGERNQRMENTPYNNALIAVRNLTLEERTKLVNTIKNQTSREEEKQSVRDRINYCINLRDLQYCI